MLIELRQLRHLVRSGRSLHLSVVLNHYIRYICYEAEWGSAARAAIGTLATAAPAVFHYIIRTSAGTARCVVRTATFFHKDRGNGRGRHDDFARSNLWSG